MTAIVPATIYYELKRELPRAHKIGSGALSAASGSINVTVATTNKHLEEFANARNWSEIAF